MSSMIYASAAARPDYSSLDGAAALKAQIDAAWAARGGLTPYVWIEPCLGGAHHVIASDMLNGMPRQTGASA